MLGGDLGQIRNRVIVHVVPQAVEEVLEVTFLHQSRGCFAQFNRLLFLIIYLFVLVDRVVVAVVN